MKKIFHIISPIRRDPHRNSQFKFLCDAFCSDDIPQEDDMQRFDETLLFLPVYQLRFLSPNMPPVGSRRKSKRELWNTINWQEAQEYHKKMSCKRVLMDRSPQSVDMADKIRKVEERQRKVHAEQMR